MGRPWIMQFESNLECAVLVKRYKRFLADIKLSNGEVITIHCPNTGSMMNCQHPGNKVWYSVSNKKTRKYSGTWQFIEVNNGELVGVNTGLANKLVVEAIENRVINQFSNFSKLRTEVPYGNERNSRIDILLEEDSGSECYIEVKNVSLGMSRGVGLFPDAITTRGQKHLKELIAMKKTDARAVLFFCVQHTGIRSVSPAENIDPIYTKLMKEAMVVGVEFIAYKAAIDTKLSRIELEQELPVKV